MAVIDDHREEHRADLRHRELDANRRLDEVPVDAEEDDDERSSRKDRELRRVARLRPGDGRHLPRPAVEQEAHERREDQDVHRRVLGGHDAEVAQHRVDDPPMARISETVAMIDRGVAQTMKQSVTAISRYLMYF